MIAGCKKPLITLFCSGLSSISGPEVEGVLGNLVTVTCVARGEIQVIRNKISNTFGRCILYKNIHSEKDVFVSCECARTR